MRKIPGVFRGRKCCELLTSGIQRTASFIVSKWFESSVADTSTLASVNPELVFQRYGELAGQNVNQLESVVRCSVSNPGTIDTLKKAFANMGQPHTENGAKVVFHANAQRTCSLRCDPSY